MARVQAPPGGTECSGVAGGHRDRGGSSLLLALLLALPLASAAGWAAGRWWWREVPSVASLAVNAAAVAAGVEAHGLWGKQAAVGAIAWGRSLAFLQLLSTLQEELLEKLQAFWSMPVSALRKCVEVSSSDCGLKAKGTDSAVTTREVKTTTFSVSHSTGESRNSPLST